jgi:hypothetical protein
MDDLIATIAAEADLEPAVARKAVAIIVAFLAREGPADDVRNLMDRLPGAGGLAAEAPDGGGGIMGVYGDLTAAGLNLGAVQTAARQFVGYARAKAGGQAVDAVVNAIPGLSQFV